MKRQILHVDVNNAFLSWTAVDMLKKGNKEDILSKMKDLNNRRITKQPLEFPSAGSTFKRPAGLFAGAENSLRGGI